ncbi:MAG: TrkH family potassium uptake protein [Ruminococcaceae bacterium]|nr:TrkH family potassium uptake protein [Oscillospiraceae bacterium]
MNYKMVSYVLGWVLKIEAGCLLLPLICSFIYNDSGKTAIILSIVLCLITGILLSVKSPKNKTMFAKEGFVTVALCWIVMSIFGAVPFYISGGIKNFADAVFETASGFTTTGASILAEVESLPKSLIMWRSFTHWIGGMGVLVFLVALLPSSSGDNMYLIKAESPGPSVSKMVPKVRSMAKILYLIYLGMTVLQFILLKAGGMDTFDAITITFGTAGTGGFTVRNSGFADYTAYQQWVIIVFMILFGIDFSVYYLILLRKFKTAIRSVEVRTYICIILVSILLIAINCHNLYGSLSDNIRHTSFTVGSIITTTGYATVDFDKWNSFSKTILVGLMFVGACAGSTGGGIKVSRIIILFKSILKETKVAVHPQRTVKITMNGRLVEHETVRAVNVYMAAYIAIFAVAVLIISLDNFDFTTNFTAIAATINNIGPGLAGVGPMENFSAFSDLSTVVMTIVMIIGRLEIFPILILFSKSTWKR